ncbi:MAG: hypothetical protein AAGE85_05580 [Pseudomonadota bacterium]
MSKRAWYLGCTSDQIAERVILLGNPARVRRLGRHLQDVEFLPVKRGLETATGYYGDTPITLSAFGMGAPIAAIALHELADLGASVFLRFGTAIALPPARIGEFLIANSALRKEGTSGAYAPDDYPAVADETLTAALIAAAKAQTNPFRVGKFASYDGFYRDMFAIDEASRERVRRNYAALAADDVIAVDMETSAILTVGKVLGCKVAALCLASVDSATQSKIEPESLRIAEARLVGVAFEAMAAVQTA